MRFLKICDFCEKKETLKSREICSDCEEKMMNPKYALEWEAKKKNNLKENPSLSLQRIPVNRAKPGELIKIIFYAVAFIWFIVMLPTQLDFIAIIIGWLVIAVVYWIFRFI